MVVWVWVCGYWCGQEGCGCLDDPGTLASGSLCNQWIIQCGQRRQAFPGDGIMFQWGLRSLLAAPSQLCYWTERKTFILCFKLKLSGCWNKRCLLCWALRLNLQNQWVKCKCWKSGAGVMCVLIVMLVLFIVPFSFFSSFFTAVSPDICNINSKLCIIIYLGWKDTRKFVLQLLSYFGDNW